MLSKSELSQLCELAKTAALEAGDYIQSQFETNVIKQKKVGGDSIASQIVTEVDLKGQELIVDKLAESIQNYDFGLLTEEAVDDQSRLNKDYFWCIDPLDGTLPFTEKRTGYAVSIASPAFDISAMETALPVLCPLRRKEQAMPFPLHLYQKLEMLLLGW